MSMNKPSEGRARVVIEAVQPEINCGRFAAKRVTGQTQAVEADIFADGHDKLDARLLYRAAGAKKWLEAPMVLFDNDRWRGAFTPDKPGKWEFTIEAWVDHFLTWQYDFRKRVDGAQIEEIPLQLQIGTTLVTEAARRAKGGTAKQLRTVARQMKDANDPQAAIEAALSVALTKAMQSAPDRRYATRYERELAVWVDRPRAQFSSWYEMFPRSTGADGAHGTFKTATDVLPYVASMGFDILYLPPISPIGAAFRKGRNNSTVAGPEDSGSPWAIGAPEGGHTAIHPALGTIEDFRAFREAAEKQGIEIALDIAFQCSPDHPWVKEHPAFFKHRPDGSIQYAENPPKKYQDIYPIDFESAEWRTLWDELLGVFLYWAGEGVRVFRVDNPHTKAFPFWEWCIASVREKYPDAIFLAEAFTRPKVMYRLAKLGYTQSYTYFTWRNDGASMREYLTELTTDAPKYFFRPNLWPNTPDILHAQLQTISADAPPAQVRAAYASRFLLAATLSSNYGIYGPAFELQESLPVRPGSEEYLDSEKYEIRNWNKDLRRDRKDSLRPLIAHVNRIRRAELALQTNDTLAFHDTDNPQLLCYSKSYTPPERSVSADVSVISVAGSDASIPQGNSVEAHAEADAATEARRQPGSERLLILVNLDPRNYQAGYTRLDMAELGLDWTKPFTVEDLLTGVYDLDNTPANEPVPEPHGEHAVYTWRDRSNFVSLAPGRAHIFRIRQD